MCVRSSHSMWYDGKHHVIWNCTWDHPMLKLTCWHLSKWSRGTLGNQVERRSLSMVWIMLPLGPSLEQTLASSLWCASYFLLVSLLSWVKKYLVFNQNFASLNIYNFIVNTYESCLSLETLRFKYWVMRWMVPTTYMSLTCLPQRRPWSSQHGTALAFLVIALWGTMLTAMLDLWKALFKN